MLPEFDPVILACEPQPSEPSAGDQLNQRHCAVPADSGRPVSVALTTSQGAMMSSKKHAGAAAGSGICGDAVRVVAKLRLALVAVAVVLPAAPSHAEMIEYVSATGAGSICSATQPCADIATAFVTASVDINSNSARVICLNGSDAGGAYSVYPSGVTLDVDCPLGLMTQLNIGAVDTVRLRHLTFRNGGGSQILFQGGGTLILEDCVFMDTTSVALDIEPNAPLNIVIRNSRISNSASGLLLKPATGGSIKATFDHVTITGHSGGGIKTDSTNGAVDLDIADSVISNNGGNGINLVGGAGGQNMLNLGRTVIAKNAVAGLQTNGATAAALVEMTLFDTNTSGAITVINGGRVLTYGNNRIVGTAGSGFTGSASLQ